MAKSGVNRLKLSKKTYKAMKKKPKKKKNKGKK